MYRNIVTKTNLFLGNIAALAATMEAGIALTWRHVYGHSSDIMNERADGVAELGSRGYHQQLAGLGGGGGHAGGGGVVCHVSRRLRIVHRRRVVVLVIN